jgi:hypothetical protein
MKSGCYNEQFLAVKSGFYTEHICYNERMLQRTVYFNEIRMLQRTVLVNEIRMLQRTVLINEIRMLQRTHMLRRTNATTNSFYR